MSNTAQAPSQSKQSKKSVANTVNVITVIDTDIIKQTYGPNTSPQGLNNHEGITMSCPAANYQPDPGGDRTNITFTANVHDYVSFRATSVSNNSEDAVIIYGIESTDNVNVFNPFHVDMILVDYAAIPDIQKQPNGMPATTAALPFYSYDSQVQTHGQESFIIRFAIYELDPQSGDKQSLYGLYYWDPKIIVSQPGS
jgi:hypothetical protein